MYYLAQVAFLNYVTIAKSIIIRHEKYDHQYRAMFVQNCVINENKFLKEEKNDDCSLDSYLFEVCCSICKNNVGLYNIDEKMYYFYEVIPSLG